MIDQHNTKTSMNLDRKTAEGLCVLQGQRRRHDWMEKVSAW